MFLVVVNGVVINSAEPVMDSFLRQMIERNVPADNSGWVACWLLSLQAAEQSFGRKSVLTMLN